MRSSIDVHNHLLADDVVHELSQLPGPLRDPLRADLAARRIGTEIYYPIPLHLQVCFASLGHETGDFPHSEAAASETLALPMYPELAEEQVERICAALRGLART